MTLCVAFVSSKQLSFFKGRHWLVTNTCLVQTGAQAAGQKHHTCNKTKHAAKGFLCHSYHFTSLVVMTILVGQSEKENRMEKSLFISTLSEKQMQHDREESITQKSGKFYSLTFASLPFFLWH